MKCKTGFADMLNCVTSFWMVRWGRKAAPNTCVDIILVCPPHSKLLLTPHPEEWILLLFARTRGAAQARTLAVVFKMLTFDHLLLLCSSHLSHHLFSFLIAIAGSAPDISCFDPYGRFRDPSPSPLPPFAHAPARIIPLEKYLTTWLFELSLWPEFSLWE